jgi:predicted porin
VVAVIAIAAASVVGVVIYKKVKAKINPRDHSDEEKVQPTGKNPYNYDSM